MTDSTAPEAPELAAAPPSRAGRNLPVAITVGLGLLGLVVLALWWRDEAFLALAVLASSAALWELAHAFTRRDLHLPLVPLLVGGVGILVSAFYAGAEAQLVSLMLTVGGIVIWRIVDGNGPSALRDCVAGAFAAVYVPFLAGFVVLMLDAPSGGRRVLLFILLVVASDVGGYTAGVLLGRHPMAPRVSPKKTWEGFAGSLVLSVAVGAVGAHFGLAVSAWIGIVVAVGAVLASTLGDLTESMLKRDLGLKDMGTLLPGHGGVLDRLDSLLVAAPVAYVLYLVLLPVVG
jgi:phosphatidate cytidylyltransferase